MKRSVSDGMPHPQHLVLHVMARAGILNRIFLPLAGICEDHHVPLPLKAPFPGLMLLKNPGPSAGVLYPIHTFRTNIQLSIYSRRARWS